MLIMSLATSKYCPSADQSLNVLLHQYTLPKLYKLKEMIDIYESYEIARHRDDKENQDRSGG